MRIIVFLFTIFIGKKAGEDIFGNQYYYSKFKSHGRERRWVWYKGIVEASKIPVAWDCWLRHMVEAVPKVTDLSLKYHTPNLTGTKGAFNPRIYNEKIALSHLYKPWNNK